MSEVTTVQISRRIKKELEALKIHPRETFNDVLERIIEDRRPLNADTLDRLERAREDIRAGRSKSHEQVRRELGL